MLIAFIVSLLISLPSIVFASSEQKKPPHRTHVNKATFLSTIRQSLIPFFYKHINKNKVLHTLFQKHHINKVTFEKQMHPLLKQCIAQFRNQIPAQVNAIDVILWNHEIFNCASNQYRLLYIDNDFKKAITKTKFLNLFQQHTIDQYFFSLKKSPFMRKWLDNENLNKERFNYKAHPMVMKCIAHYQPQIPASLTMTTKHYWNKKLLHCVSLLMIDSVTNED